MEDCPSFLEERNLWNIPQIIMRGEPKDHNTRPPVGAWKHYAHQTNDHNHTKHDI
jgi:hypothetical protein